MKKHIVFLEPRGTAFKIIEVAKLNSYYIIILTTDISYFLNQAVFNDFNHKDIHSIIEISDWDNVEDVFQLIKEKHSDSNIVGVYANGDQSLEAMCRLREEFRLPTMSYENISTLLNKYETRKKLNSVGLSSIKFFHGRDVDKWDDWQLNGPGYFKPIRGTMSLYVKKCENLSTLNDAKEKWITQQSVLPKIYDRFLHSNNYYMVEEEIDGELISVEALNINGRFICLGILSRIMFEENSVIEMGSCFPYNHPKSIEIIDIVEKAHRYLGINEGPTHTELIVGKDKIEIIDLNLRFAGAHVLHSINYAFEIKFENILFDWIINNNKSKFKYTNKYFSCLQYIMPPYGIDYCNSIIFPEDPDIRYSAKLILNHTKVPTEPTQADVIGVYLTIGSTFDAAIRKSKSLRNQIFINDNKLGRY